MLSITDTIVALATPPGEGAIGIIRLSGNEAIIIANHLFRGKNLLQQATHTLHFGKIVHEGQTIDEVLISLFRNPHSYTGEDVVEISCHGSQYILQHIIALCLQQGARMAKAGEFTLRAFLKGKLDLTQAEAVADLIASQSSAAHKAAMHNLRGGFSNQLKDMREELIRFAALVELELDFSQEDVEFADRTQLNELIQRIAQNTAQLLHTFTLGNAIKNGVSVAIVGKPNAGKSTLLNTLLNEERAIVSDIAGTTRDTIEETLNINGILFRLIDTAGIREHTTDTIEQIGVARSKAARSQADIVVYLFDVNDTDTQELQQEIQFMQQEAFKFLLVGNKCDTLELGQLNHLHAAIYPTPLYIAARNNLHIHQLKEALFQLVSGGSITQEGTIVTNARHYAALQELHKALQTVQEGLNAQIPGDLLALDIRTCLQYLGDITGEVSNEDKLDYIFSKFCIGK
jgi:tRNA modification GTPase